MSTLMAKPVLDPPRSSQAPIPAPQPPTASPFHPAMLAFLALLGYSAMLLTGFDTHLGMWRPVPVYIFLAALVYCLQLAISQRFRVEHTLYVIGAFLFTGLIIFKTANIWQPLHHPMIYVLANAALYGVVIGDAIWELWTRPHPAGVLPARFMTITANFVGLALIAYFSAIVCALLQQGNPQLVNLDLNQAWNLHLPSTIANLQQINLVIGMCATAVSLLLIGIASSIATSPQQPGATTTDPEVNAVSGFGNLVRQIVSSALDDVTLRWLAGSFAWLIAAFSSGALAFQIADYLQSAAPSSRLIDLFNPFSAHSVARYGQGLASIGWLLVVALSTVCAIGLIEHNRTTLQRAFTFVRESGQTLVLSLAFFTISLAAINAVAVYLHITAREPFQVSGITLAALIAAGLLILDAQRRAHREQRQAHNK